MIFLFFLFLWIVGLRWAVLLVFLRFSCLWSQVLAGAGISKMVPLTSPSLIPSFDEGDREAGLEGC